MVQSLKICVTDGSGVNHGVRSKIISRPSGQPFEAPGGFFNFFCHNPSLLVV